MLGLRSRNNIANPLLAAGPVLDWNTDAVAFYNVMGANNMGEGTVRRIDGPVLERLAARG